MVPFIPIFRFDGISFQKPFFKSVFQPESSLPHLTYPISLSIYSICRKASLPLIAKYVTKKKIKGKKKTSISCVIPVIPVETLFISLKISYQHGGRHFSEDHVYVRLRATRNFMKAHLSPPHNQSRKRLHFFFHGIANWTCSSQSSFLFPISPSSHGSSPYGSVVAACAHINLHIWCHSIVGSKHTSPSAYSPLAYFFYIKLFRRTFTGRKWELSTPFHPLRRSRDGMPITQKLHYSWKTNTFSMTAIKQSHIKLGFKL